MKTKKIIASIIIFILIFFSLSANLFARDNLVSPEYAPGQLIVKLKEGQFKAGIEALNEKYKVSSQEKVFKDTPNPQETLKQLKAKSAKLGITHDKWYWQLDKNSQEYKYAKAKINAEKSQLAQQIQAQEELIAHLEQRQKRTPKTQQPPNLDNIYVLNIPKDTNIPQMARDYQSSPIVEYAEPNYIIKIPILPDLSNLRSADIIQLAPQTAQAVTAKSFPYALSNDTYLDPDQNGTWSTGSYHQSYEDLWGLKKIEADKVWAITQGEGVVVAVIDSGVDYNHEDLKDNIWINSEDLNNNHRLDNGEDRNNDGILDYREDINCNGKADMWPSTEQRGGVFGDLNGIDNDNNGYVDDIRGWNFSKDTGLNNVMDTYGHGTSLAGIIAAIGDNKKGIIGVAPKAKIMAVKGFSNYAGGTDQELALAVKYAVDNGARVLNNSWGAEVYSWLLVDIFNYAYRKNCVAVAAAGNDNRDMVNSTPANIDTVIAVSASTQNDEKCSFSDYGDKVLIVAPGGGYSNEFCSGANILSTIPLNTDLGGRVSPGYSRVAGTSAACPYVAGVAALILANNLQLTPVQVRQIIQESADDIGQPGKDIYFGYGRVNAKNAVKLPMDLKLIISKPIDKSYIQGRAQIEGAADFKDDFQRYELYLTPQDKPKEITVIVSSNQPVENGVLGSWDTTQVADGKYLLYLKLVSLKNKEYIVPCEVTVDNINEPPVFINLSNRGAVVGSRLEFKVEAQDPDDPSLARGQLAYVAANLPPGAHFDWLTQLFSWALDKSENATYATYEVTFKVGDNEHIVNKKIVITTRQIKQTEITTYPVRAVIYKNKILWDDWRNSGLDSLYVYDLSANTETFVTSCDSNSSLHHYAMYEDKIVWYNDSSNVDVRGIYVYDLSTHTQERIIYTNLTRGYGDYKDLAIYKNKIVWADTRDRNIYLYDLSSRVVTKINNLNLWAYGPAIYEDKIVWQYSYGQNRHDIYMYDLATHVETKICNSGDAYAPAIYEDRIVWQDIRNGKQNIYMYDLATHTETQISNRGDAHKPAIYKDIIIWRNGDSTTIDRYDLDAREETRISSGPNYIASVAIYGNKIVWVDFYNKKICIAEILDSPQITSVNLRQASKENIITIIGYHFGDTQGLSRIEFTDGRILAVQDWSNTRITCKVPIEALGSPIRVVTEGGSSNTMAVDNFGPIQCFVIINNGAPATKSRNVTLTLSASDTVSGLSEMIFSNDGINYSSPVVYSVSQSWCLTPGDEEKMVYVKFKDGAGNWSESVSGTIILDTIAPQTTVLDADKNTSFDFSKVYADMVRISFDTSDVDKSLGTRIYFTTDNREKKNFIPYGLGNKLPIPANCTLRFYSKDRAGNEEPMQTRQININRNPVAVKNKTVNPITIRPDGGILFQAQVLSQTSTVQSVRLILERSTSSGQRITHNYAMNYNPSSGFYETILYKSSSAKLLNVSYKIEATDSLRNSTGTPMMNVGDI